MRRMVIRSGLVAAILLVATSCVSPMQQQKDTVDRLLGQSAVAFGAQASNATFRAQNPALDFGTDGCSNWFLPDHMNDTGATYDFTLACWHHDFGYRNYKRFKAAGMVADVEGTRGLIDMMFLDDMKADCAARPSWQQPTCKSRADLYFWLVRKYGQI
ncbi:MAG: hypothetical protein JST73_12670 [Actinobacteria bacterium]|nr:hypothetical protein [Actinomycetota bacterium]